ncbi:hypothetical protein D3C86_2071460 [compost metagenome]
MLVESHEDAVRFQYLGLHLLFGNILRRQVAQTLGTGQRRPQDIEHLIEAHRFQQAGDVRVGGHQGR